MNNMLNNAFAQFYILFKKYRDKVIFFQTDTKSFWCLDIISSLYKLFYGAKDFIKILDLNYTRYF